MRLLQCCHQMPCAQSLPPSSHLAVCGILRWRAAPACTARMLMEGCCALPMTRLMTCGRLWGGYGHERRRTHWKTSCTRERGLFAAQLTLDLAMSSKLASLAESACRSRMPVNQLCGFCVTLTKNILPRFLNVQQYLGRGCLLH